MEFSQQKEIKKRRNITDDDAAEIIKMIFEGISVTKISKQFGISRTSVYDIKHGRTWSHIERPKRPILNTVTELQVPVTQCLKTVSYGGINISVTRRREINMPRVLILEGFK